MQKQKRMTKAAIFARCETAVKAKVSGGKMTPMHIENMRRGHRILRTLIADINSKKPKYKSQVERALRDLHPRTEYCDDMLIRDLADVGVTLTRLMQGRRRSVEKPMTDAGFLCEYLKEEFAEQHLPNHDAS